MNTYSKLSLLCSAALLATVIACSTENQQEPTATLGHRSRAVWGSQTTYYVQGLTTENGQFWSNCSGNSVSKVDNTHQHDTIPGYPRTTHSDSISFYTLNGGCQGSGAFNGGWINVYDYADGNPQYLGQVQGNLVNVAFSHEGTTPRTVRLDAYPDVTRGCTLVGFSGYAPGTSSITVSSGDGWLPYAEFAC